MPVFVCVCDKDMCSSNMYFYTENVDSPLKSAFFYSIYSPIPIENSIWPHLCDWAYVLVVFTFDLCNIRKYTFCTVKYWNTQTLTHRSHNNNNDWREISKSHSFSERNDCMPFVYSSIINNFCCVDLFCCCYCWICFTSMFRQTVKAFCKSKYKKGKKYWYRF